MSVEYKHFLIPAKPRFRPSAERLVRLLTEMEKGGFLLRSRNHSLDGPSFDSRLDAGDIPEALTADWLRERKSMLRLAYPMQGKFRYPLDRGPFSEDTRAFAVTLEVHWSRHFLRTDIEGFDELRHRKTDCGVPAFRQPDEAPFADYLVSRCPTCKRSVDFDFKLRYWSPWSGETRRVRAGGLHRFALLVDCGSEIPEDTGETLHVHPDLVALVESVLGCKMQTDLGLVY